MDTLTAAGEAKRRFLFNLLFLVMLVIAAGNTALQSVMPAMGRLLGVPDTVVAGSFSFSAFVWAIAAPFWAKRSDRSGRKRMVLTGLIGFVVSLTGCGIALSLGVFGWIPPLATFAAFIASRLIYGFFGAATAPAAQAIVAARTSRAERTNALTMLASAFGLGTILGPALAPFFVIGAVGLAGPAYAFMLFGLATLIVTARMLPDDMPGEYSRGAAASEPSIGGEPSGATVIAAVNEQSDAPLKLTDARIWPWMVLGLLAGHAQAMAGQAMGFLIMDRLRLSPVDAQPMIGLVLMAGAGTALLAQWGIIPRLRLPPSQMVFWGAAISAVGCFGIAISATIHSLAVAFAVASLGFGFIRPGFTAGSSLAVSSREQGQVAGRVTAVNGAVFVLGPFIGIGLYEIDPHFPYLLSGAVMVIATVYARRKLTRRG